MKFDDAVKQAREIGQRTSHVAFIHTRPGSADYNFRFDRPIESVPGAEHVTVARVDLDGKVTETPAATRESESGIVSTPKQPRVIGIQRELEPLNAAGIKYAAYLTEPDGPNDYRLTTPLYLSGETLEAVKVRVLGVEKVSAWFYAYRITDFIEPIRTA